MPRAALASLLVVAAAVAGMPASARAADVPGRITISSGRFPQVTPKVGASLGDAIAGVGDVDHDGRADVAIASFPYDIYEDPHSSDPPLHANGYVRVVSGTPDRASTVISDVSATGLTLYSAGKDFFPKVAGAGDVNGDAIPDIVVTRVYGPDDKAAYVVYGGGPAGDLDLDALGGRGFVLRGEASSTAAAAGDVNHDGIGDLIVGSPNGTQGDGSTYDPKHVFVVYGKAGVTGTVDLRSLGSRGVAILDADQPDLAGTTVSGAGDLNGDGIDDVAISAGNYGRGFVAVVYGGTALPQELDVNHLGDAGYKIDGTGNPETDVVVQAMAPAGDVDGDGHDDLVVGAPRYPLRQSTGAVWVIFGQTGPYEPGFSFTHLGVHATMLEGGYGDSLGASVDSAGDYNGDGHPDLLLGAPTASRPDPGLPNGGPQGGAAFVVYGGNRLSGLPRLPYLQPSGGLRIEAVGAPSRLGAAVAGVGDLDGDGGDDIAVGDGGTGGSSTPNGGFRTVARGTVYLLNGPKCADLDGPGTGDPDGDGLCTRWEKDGIDVDHDGTVDVRLPGADPLHKDLYVEIDSMSGHSPSPTALEAVEDAYENAPVTNPDGSDGITPHFEVSDEVPHVDQVDFGPHSGAYPTTFDDIKRVWFGSAFERAGAARVLKARRLAYHYALFGHQYRDSDTSGIANLWGPDLMVTVGQTVDGEDHSGTEVEQAGTLFHELGHNLGLHHGGDDDVNCKPNYDSRMNYTVQLRVDRPLDYSTARLPTLNESALDERTGFGGAFTAPFGPAPFVEAPTDAPHDYNRDGDTDDTNVAADLNALGTDDCPGSSPGQVLTGYNDWPNVRLDFQNSPAFARGAETPIPEAETVTEATDADFRALGLDADADGVADFEDVCPELPDPGQADSDRDGVGDACDADLGSTGPSGPTGATGTSPPGGTPGPGPGPGPPVDPGGSSPPAGLPPSGVEVPAGPGGPVIDPPTGLLPPARDTVRPVVSALRRTRAGLTLRLSEAAAVRVTLARGRSTRTLRTTARAGVVSLTLPRRLRPGRYVATVVATDPAGNQSQASRLRFRVGG